VVWQDRALIVIKSILAGVGTAFTIMIAQSVALPMVGLTEFGELMGIVTTLIASTLVSVIAYHRLSLNRKA
jgi:hypothetical protein